MHWISKCKSMGGLCVPVRAIRICGALFRKTDVGYGPHVGNASYGIQRAQLQCLRKAFMKILAAAHLHHTLRADAARLLSAAHWRSCVNTEWLLKCYWNAVRVRTVPLTLNETHPDAGPRQNFLWWNRNFTSSVVTCQKHATVQNLP
jgi:hypothetical protein